MTQHNSSSPQHDSRVVLIPFALMDDAPRSIRPSVTAVYAAMNCAAMNGQDSTQKTVQEATGLGRSRFKAAMDWLYQQGWLVDNVSPDGTKTTFVRHDRPCYQDQKTTASEKA